MNERGEPSADLARISIEGEPWVALTAWAGPWPLDERWWDARERKRYARWQVLTADERAFLLGMREDRWWVEALYD